MKNKLFKALAIFIWILIWQVVGIFVDNEIFLATPLTVLLKIIDLSQNWDFWTSILFSFSRIVSGFLIGSAAGIIIAGMSYRYGIIKTFIWPLISVIKSAPVVSFIILFLILMSSRNLSILISFLMVLPIVYTNVLKGFENTDKKMLEMARLFRVKSIKKIKYIYLPSVYPFFYSACQVSLGLCWKSGITAELVGTPSGSIGEKLYQAKLYLDTGELFAWTLIIILISIVFEKFFLAILKIAMKKFREVGYEYSN